MLACVLSQQTRCEEQEKVKPRAFPTVFSPHGGLCCNHHFLLQERVL